MRAWIIGSILLNVNRLIRMMWLDFVLYVEHQDRTIASLSAPCAVMTTRL